MMNTVKVLDDGVIIPSKYIKDVEGLADRVRCELDDGLSSLGLPSFSSDITYRASSAWNDNLTYYCYYRSCSSASIDLSSVSNPFSTQCLSLRRSFSLLIVYSQFVYLFGGQLTFDEHGKHTVFFNGRHF